jgi:uncharacterized protein YoxC
MGVYIQFWEIALLIIAAAIVVAVVFLVKSLKNINTTVSHIQKMLDEHEKEINNIITNTNETMSNAADITKKAQKGVQGVDNIVSNVIEARSPSSNVADAIVNYSKYGLAAVSVISSVISYRKKKKRKKKYKNY